jgi:hypothetical protein
MENVVGSITRRAALVACLALAGADPARAQTELVAPPEATTFLSRFDFHLAAAALASGDERFLWDTHWGGDFDFVDYVKGRVTFVADYQAVLGGQLQPFDPNQGNYTLAASTSVRVGGSEVVFFFDHVSRHLGDRPKTFGIAWNVLGTRLLMARDVGPLAIDLRLEGGVVTQRAHVDYDWKAGFGLGARRTVTPRVTWVGRLTAETYGVVPSVAGRTGQQWAGNVEGGVRLAGAAAALELFVGYAKLIDADPITRESGQWAFGGFRVVSN